MSRFEGLMLGLGRYAPHDDYRKHDSSKSVAMLGFSGGSSSPKESVIGAIVLELLLSTSHGSPLHEMVQCCC